MEEKKRTMLAVAISCIILLAVVYSFGLNYFRSTPEIVLADPDASASQYPNTDTPGEQGGIAVEVTPETVQSIIASLSRYKSYSRTIEIQYSWGEDRSSVITAQVRADDGWIRCDTILASGVTEHSIIGEETLWYWYDEGKDCIEGPASQKAEDLLQYIPTYEDVLAVEASQITDCGYGVKDDVSCIFVEVYRQKLEYVERYWISVTSGLLIAAETEKNGQVVYAMSSGDLVSPMAGENDAFTLPDGTLLHVLQN